MSIFYAMNLSVQPSPKQNKNKKSKRIEESVFFNFISRKKEKVVLVSNERISEPTKRYGQQKK
jgi:hypothetical protein